MSMLTERLDQLYTKHGDKVVGQYHNMLWQIMMNRSVDGAFTVMHTDPNGSHIVVCQRDGGYVPTNVFLADGWEDISDQIEEFIDELNEIVFGLTRYGAERVVIMSLDKKVEAG